MIRPWFLPDTVVSSRSTVGVLRWLHCTGYMVRCPCVVPEIGVFLFVACKILWVQGLWSSGWQPQT